MTAEQLPVVLFADGSCWWTRSRRTLAARVGLSTQATQEFYDMVGGGRGPGGAGGRRLWRQRGIADAGHRARCARRTGGLHLAD